MTRTEIRTKIRYNIREATAAVWADAELNYWINDVQREVSHLLHPTYNPKLIEMSSISVASNDNTVSLPTGFIQMLGNADLASNTYVYTPIHLVRPKIIGDFAYDTNKKICWLQSDLLYLHPTPTTSEDGKLIRFPYLKVATDFASNDTTGSLGDVAYALVVDKVSAVAWSKLDSQEAQTEAKKFFDLYYNDLEKLNKKFDKKNDTGTIKT